MIFPFPLEHLGLSKDGSTTNQDATSSSQMWYVSHRMEVFCSSRIPPAPIPTLEEAARGSFFIAGGCVSAYSRSFFEKFGPLNPNVRYPDYVLSFRALLGAGCAFIDEPLIYYRVHDNSISQSLSKSEKTRRAAAQRAKHEIAEAEDCLRALKLTMKRNPRLRWRLIRHLAYQRLEARSSAGSRLTAFWCFIRAIGTGRPNAAWMFLRRDVLNWKLE